MEMNERSFSKNAGNIQDESGTRLKPLPDPSVEESSKDSKKNQMIKLGDFTQKTTLDRWLPKKTQQLKAETGALSDKHEFLKVMQELEALAKDTSDDPIIQDKKPAQDLKIKNQKKKKDLQEIDLEYCIQNPTPLPPHPIAFGGQEISSSYPNEILDLKFKFPSLPYEHVIREKKLMELTQRNLNQQYSEIQRALQEQDAIEHSVKKEQGKWANVELKSNLQLSYDIYWNNIGQNMRILMELSDQIVGIRLKTESELELLHRKMNEIQAQIQSLTPILKNLSTKLNKEKEETEILSSKKKKSTEKVANLKRKPSHELTHSSQIIKKLHINEFSPYTLQSDIKPISDFDFYEKHLEIEKEKIKTKTQIDEEIDIYSAEYIKNYRMNPTNKRQTRSLTEPNEILILPLERAAEVYQMVLPLPVIIKADEEETAMFNQRSTFFSLANYEIIIKIIAEFLGQKRDRIILEAPIFYTAKNIEKLKEWLFVRKFRTMATSSPTKTILLGNLRPAMEDLNRIIESARIEDDINQNELTKENIGCRKYIITYIFRCLIENIREMLTSTLPMSQTKKNQMKKLEGLLNTELNTTVRNTMEWLDFFVMQDDEKNYDMAEFSIQNMIKIETNTSQKYYIAAGTQLSLFREVATVICFKWKCYQDLCDKAEAGSEVKKRMEMKDNTWKKQFSG